MRSGGDWVEIVAPGESIVSALPGGRYGLWSGTSMSAPIISGVTALVKAKYLNLNPDCLVDQVKETAIDGERYCHPRRGRIRTQRVDALRAVTISPPQVCVAP